MRLMVDDRGCVSTSKTALGNSAISSEKGNTILEPITPLADSDI